MGRHTTFRYQLDPTDEQAAKLARHAGASRFAYNQCLHLHRQARKDHDIDRGVVVPWTGFDFINAFNSWKKTADAGRVFAVAADSTAEITTTGLRWPDEVCQQVFEEAAVDLGKALKTWFDSRRGIRAGKRIGYPRMKRKGRRIESFRLRNKTGRNGRGSILVGDSHPRSVTMPGVGTVRVFDDTRALRRMLVKGRGKVLFATVTHQAGRWWVSLNVAASVLHPDRQHPAHTQGDATGWMGIDRGLSAFAVAATCEGTEVARIDGDAVPRPLTNGLKKLRRLGRNVTRKPRGSSNRRKAAAALGRYHHRIASIRKNFLHAVVNELVKTHDRLAIEDLNIASLLLNHRLARAISDAGWAEFARILAYKQAWRGGQLIVADRWFPSSKTCSDCGEFRSNLGLAERTHVCNGCGLSIDRDLNAAINLAAWAEKHYVALAGDRQAVGPETNAHRQDRAGRHPYDGETGLEDVGTGHQTAHRPD